MSLERDDGLATFLESEAERCARSQAAYNELVVRRKACRACKELRNPAAVDGGAHDSKEIGPWTRWQGSLDADLLVVGQDFGDVSYFRDHRGTDSPKNTTNANLRELLASIDISIPLPGEREGYSDLFFTNAILCLKDGGMQATVQERWFQNCGERFLRAQIELVAPRVVVGLGEKAHNAVLQAFGLPAEPIRKAILSAGTRLPTGTVAVGVYHCGARVTNITRSLTVQRNDWQRVRAAIAAPAV